MQSKVKKLLADLEKEASTPVEKFIVSSSNIQRSVFPLESVKRYVEEVAWLVYLFIYFLVVLNVYMYGYFEYDDD